MKTKKMTFKKPSIRFAPADLIFLVFAVVEFLRFFKVIAPLIANAIFVVLGLISILIVFIKKGIRNQLKVIFFIFVYIFFGILGVLTNGNIDIQEIFWPVAFIGIAMLLLNFNINHKLTKYAYYLALLAIITQIITSGSVDKINVVSSRNTISVIVLLLFSFYVISVYKNNEKISIFSVIAGSITVILAIGRSGILTFVLLIFFFMIFSFNENSQRIRNLFKTTIVLLVISVFLFSLYLAFEPYVVDTIKNFENRGLESVRINLWNDYFDKVFKSIRYILFGAPIEGTYLLNMFSSNLHNSLLMLHAKYGILIFLSIILFTIRTLFYFVRVKNYLYFTLLFVILFRMQFDYTNFSAQLDVIFFYLIFFKNYEKVSKKSTVIMKGEEGK